VPTLFASRAPRASFKDLALLLTGEIDSDHVDISAPLPLSLSRTPIATGLLAVANFPTDAVGTLHRILTMSVTSSLPLHAIICVWRELVLPDDFEDCIIEVHPHLLHGQIITHSCSLVENGSAGDPGTAFSFTDGATSYNKPRSNLAAALLDEMLHMGIPTDPLAYTTMLNSLCRKKQLRGACCLLSLMRCRGFSPVIMHHNIVIVGIRHEGRPLDACKVVGDMVDSGCTPNALTYAKVVSGLCVSGLYDKVEAYLVDMVGKGLVPHFSLFHSVTRGCCIVVKVEEVAQIMSRMLDLGVVMHVEIWSPVISTYVQTYLIEGDAFWVVGMNSGEWTDTSCGTYNKWDGVSHYTT
jgi:pentatricopeptide repeat protein